MELLIVLADGASATYEPSPAETITGLILTAIGLYGFVLGLLRGEGVYGRGARRERHLP